MNKKTIAYLLFVSTVLLFFNSCMPLYKMMGMPLTVRCVGSGPTSVSSAYSNNLFAFSYCNNNRSFIAVGDYKTGKVGVILSSTDGTIYLRPIFSISDNKIIFIARKTVDKSALYIMNIDGSEVTKLTNDTSDTNNITDIALSWDGRKIYYINSQRYSASSPVGKPAPHENDIYAISIDGKDIQRLSHDNSYGLSGIAVSADGKKIFERSTMLEIGQKNSSKLDYKIAEGLGFSSKALVYTTNFPLSRITSHNELILGCGKADSFSKDIMTGKENRPIVKGYGLFVVKVPDMEVVKEIIYLPSPLTSPAILEKEEVVLFIIIGNKNNRELWQIKLNGSNLKQIKLNDF